MATKRLFHVERKEGFTRLHFRIFSEPAPSVQCFDLVDEAARVIVEEWELNDEPPFEIYEDDEGLNFTLLDEVSPLRASEDAFLFFHAELAHKLKLGQPTDNVLGLLMVARRQIALLQREH